MILQTGTILYNLKAETPLQDLGFLCCRWVGDTAVLYQQAQWCHWSSFGTDFADKNRADRWNYFIVLLRLREIRCFIRFLDIIKWFLNSSTIQKCQAKWKVSFESLWFCTNFFSVYVFKCEARFYFENLIYL